MPLIERGILFAIITAVWTIPFFYYSILTFMKLFLMLAAIYALIINQSLKQKEKITIPVQGNMQTTPKPQNIKPDNNIYLNSSFRPDLPVKPVPKRKITNEKRSFPVKSYQLNPFKQENDLKEVNETVAQDVLYTPDISYSSLLSKDGPR